MRKLAAQWILLIGSVGKSTVVDFMNEFKLNESWINFENKIQ